MFLTEVGHKMVKETIQRNHSYKDHLKGLADQAMTKGPWSVTAIEADNSKGGPHDYYSEGPYWWPNPDKVDGPYIRRDGVFNPDHFNHHKIAMRHVCKNVLSLCSAAYHLDETTYMDKASDLIKTWFLNPDTAMTPHLEYGQSIPGICDGRGIGIIDTIVFLELLMGVAYMEMMDVHGQVINDLKKWFRQYLDWLLTSNHGIEEKENGNNHSTWWTLQVMAYSKFVGNEEGFQEGLDWFKEKILEDQVDPDGSMPEELGRTRPFHYVTFNLMPMVLIGALGEVEGEDLWHYKTSKGVGIVEALNWMLPYYEDPHKWPYPDIDELEKEDSLIFSIGQRQLKSKRYGKLHESLVQDLPDQDPMMVKMFLPSFLWA